MRTLDPRLLRRARPAAVPIALLVATGTGSAILAIAQAALIARGIASLTLAVCPPLALVIVGRAGCAWLTGLLGHRAATSVKSRLRRDVLAHVLDLGPRWLAGERTGEVTALITTGVDGLDAFLARYLPQLILAVVVPATVLIALARTDTIATLTVAATLPLVPLFMALVGMTTQARAARRWRSLGRLSHHFLDLVRGLATLKIFGRAQAQVDRLRTTSEEYRAATMGTLRLAFLSSLVLDLLTTLSVALVAVGVGLRLVHATIGWRTGLFILVLTPEAYAPLRVLATTFHASTDGLAAMGRAQEILDTGVPSPPVPTRIGQLGGDLVIDQVSVWHAGRTQPAPDRANLTVSPGEFVAVTGASGTGKSTLLAVALGFIGPDTGTVTIGGVDMTAVPPGIWRGMFAWVPQDPWLFAGTVAANIALGTPDVAHASIVEAARIAALDVDLSRPVGERGTGLSAGQRRRVAIARAVLRNAPILLLDEPTAGVDQRTEATVLRHLATTGRTIVAVTHRPTLIAAADRVISLDPLPDNVMTPEVIRSNRAMVG